MLNPQPETDMKSIFSWLLDKGLGVAVMAVFLYLFWQERRELDHQRNTCNEKLIELAQQQTAILGEIREYMRTNAAPLDLKPANYTKR